MPSSSMTPMPLSDRGTWVVCLCADWCGLCRDYQALFTHMAERYPQHCFVWLDIEDQSELVGELEVETFPTVLVADEKGTRFLGPLTPYADTLARLLDSVERFALEAAPHLPATRVLLQALQAAPQYRVGAPRRVR